MGKKISLLHVTALISILEGEFFYKTYIGKIGKKAKSCKMSPVSLINVPLFTHHRLAPSNDFINKPMQSFEDYLTDRHDIE